eukprot:jgi/Tetstr1/445909/TSEL_033538.t1
MASRLFTNIGQASQSRVDAPVITPAIHALRTLYIASPALAGISAADLDVWMSNILISMHAREAAAAAKGSTCRSANLETMAIATAEEAWQAYEARSNTAPSGAPIQPFPMGRPPTHDAFL